MVTISFRLTFGRRPKPTAPAAESCMCSVEGEGESCLNSPVEQCYFTLRPGDFARLLGHSSSSRNSSALDKEAERP